MTSTLSIKDSGGDNQSRGQEEQARDYLKKLQFFKLAGLDKFILGYSTLKLFLRMHGGQVNP